MESAETSSFEPASHVQAEAALHALWRDAGLGPKALERVQLSGAEPVLRSSFAVGVAAQASIAAAALAATEVHRERSGVAQTLRVDMRAAALECLGYFSLDGQVPRGFEKLSGLYPCGGAAAPGFVRIHANFAHHRDRALRLLGLREGEQTERGEVEAALQSWSAEDFEHAAAEAGAVVAALRSFAQWDTHPQRDAVAAEPLVAIDAIGPGDPLPLPVQEASEAPLAAIGVLDLTRILAGPIAGRTLAAYGADVMLLNAPHLPNIAAIADTSRGKLSAHVDLHSERDRAALDRLIAGARVFVQGYRPGALAGLGYGPAELAERRPGIVYVSLTTYGERGPWAARRGFDSLVQTATGFNAAEGEALGAGRPRALPAPILDCASGFLLAFGVQAALLRQGREGGSWHVRVSLARTAHWLRSLGRVCGDERVERADLAARSQRYASGFGALRALPHAAQLSLTPAEWTRPSMPPGSHPAAWPPADSVA